MSPPTTTTAPVFRTLPGRDGVVVVDPVQEEQFQFFTAHSVTPEPCATDAVPFCFPIDAAARLATDSVTIPFRMTVLVRTPDAELVETVSEATRRTISPESFCTIELSSLPFKIMLATDSRVTIDTRDGTTEFCFPDTEEFYIGARSSHLQPSRTLTTTDDPEDLMTVISEFGAALKTTSCERSWATLRGHPPLVEFGDALHLPGGSQRPETGVTIELPPTMESLIPIPSLAYYLGATLVPGDAPRLRTDTGFEFDLTTRGGYERTVSEVLQHVFTLDCFTRCEGLYPLVLTGRKAADLDLEYAALYDQPLAEQLERYLSVPFDAVEPFRPAWRVTADVPPEPSSARLFPHLVSELSVIRGNGSTSLRSGSAANSAGTQHDVLTRVPPAETTYHTYFGSGFAVGTNKGLLDAYERRFERRPADDIDISVVVVCNDERMADEVETSAYGNRDRFEFDVETTVGLTVDELRAVFESDVDFVHYIGHVGADGFACTDGVLDAGTIESVGPTAFLLNGCRSVWQGTRLVEQGALGGIVTFEDIPDRSAATLGTHIARLLNHGWQLDSAVEVIRGASLAGENYAVVGYPGTRIVDSDAAVSMVTTAVREDGRFDYRDRWFTGRGAHLGSIIDVFELNEGSYSLNGQEFGPNTVDSDELDHLLSLATIPVRVQNTGDSTWQSLQWSDEIDVHALHD